MPLKTYKISILKLIQAAKFKTIPIDPNSTNYNMEIAIMINYDTNHGEGCIIEWEL